MCAYRVNLDIFSGPLDLLLYLVRKEEVDIYDIPIAKITEQYLRYLTMLQNLDIDLASEFLVMATTLMEIKSAMLLPKSEPTGETASAPEDPRAELVRQLLEYKRFKDAANLLQAKAEEHATRFPRPDVVLAQDPGERQIDLEQVSAWDLLEAFDALCRATGQLANLGTIQDETPIDLYQIDILHRLQTEGPLTFKRLFEDKPNRIVMVMNFLALLELIRAGLVWAQQHENGGDIYLRALTDEPADVVVPRVILAVGPLVQQAEGVGEDQAIRAAPIPIQQVDMPAVGPAGQESIPRKGDDHEDLGSR